MAKLWVLNVNTTRRPTRDSFRGLLQWAGATVFGRLHLVSASDIALRSTPARRRRAVLDSMLESLAPFETRVVTAAFRQLNERLGIRPGQLLRQGHLQICLEELAMPARPQHEM
jgi:hypothetical protein